MWMRPRLDHDGRAAATLDDGPAIAANHVGSPATRASFGSFPTPWRSARCRSPDSHGFAEALKRALTPRPAAAASRLHASAIVDGHHARHWAQGGEDETVEIGDALPLPPSTGARGRAQSNGWTTGVAFHSPGGAALRPQQRATAARSATARNSPRSMPGNGPAIGRTPRPPLARRAWTTVRRSWC